MAKLAKLHLENFANLKSYDLVTGGKDGKIIGQNRVGKTTIINALCYLLTDKLLGGSSDIASVKNHDDTRAKVVVEGVFLTEEGEVTIRKEFYEKWVRPRGSANEELQGHSTDYYINGAKQARTKDFYDQLEAKFGVPTEISKVDAYQLSIDPFYLGETVCGSKEWKAARDLIMEIIGDVKPEEVYDANPDTKLAAEDLKAHQYDDAEAKKAIRAEIDGYKKKMTANEGLIAEFSKAEDVEDDDYQLAKAKDEELATELVRLKDGNENPYAQEVMKLQAEQFKLQKEYQKTATAPIDHTKSEATSKALNEAQDEYYRILREKKSVESDLFTFKNQADYYGSQLENQKKRLTDLKNESLSIMVEETCPTCGQKLPEEKVQEAFNKKKAEIIESASAVKQQAVDMKKQLDVITEQIETLKSRDFQKELAALEAKIDELKKQLTYEKEVEEAAANTAINPETTKRLEEINERLSEIQKLQSEGQLGVANQIVDIKVKREELQAIFAKRTNYQNAQTRLSEIRAENVRIGKAQADAEQRLWAVGEFVKTKLVILDKHMEAKFGEVRFQLIKENIKAGSYDEVCVPYIIDPVTGKHTTTLFPDGSKSEQIYTGIRIIKSIRDSFGWKPLPIVFDQGGELDAKSAAKVAYDAEAQIISVKVEGTATMPTFVPLD